MIFPKALKKELNDGLFLKCEVILIYLGCVEVLALVVVKSELPLDGLPEMSCARSLEDLEINGFEMIEGLFVEKEHLRLERARKDNQHVVRPLLVGRVRMKRKKECVGGRRHTEILANDLEGVNHGPTIWIQLSTSY